MNTEQKQATGWSTPTREIKFFPATEDQKKEIMFPETEYATNLIWSHGMTYNIKTQKPDPLEGPQTWFYRTKMFGKDTVSVALVFKLSGGNLKSFKYAAVMVVTMEIDENLHIVPGVLVVEPLVRNPLLLSLMTNFEYDDPKDLENMGIKALFAARDFSQIKETF